MEENVLQLRDEASVHAKYTDMIHSDLSLLRTAITECRMFKSEAEVEIMRKAAAITAKAHIALMKAVKSGSCVNEQQLHALFEYTCFFHGAKFQAYTPIVAKGKNGAVLHYVKNDESFIDNEKNDMILVDAGCELQLYASDVTRTFPISGTYSGDWKTTYEIVLDSQKAVLDAMKPGIQWEDMHRLAYRIICQGKKLSIREIDCTLNFNIGLQKVGILVGASTEELIANHIPALFFPHGLGHSLGIDVHDCGGYPAGVDRIQEPGIRYLRMRRELLPGMVVTVEPGVYFIDALLDPALSENVDVFVKEQKWEN